MKTKVITGATIKSIEFDIINGIATLMVGSKFVQLNIIEYRELKRHFQNRTSGVKQISELVWYYSRKNVIFHIPYGNGAASRRVEQLLRLKLNY